LSIGVEKAKYALGLLEWLYQSIQQHAIKAAVPELNAILVMLTKAFIVHSCVVRYQEHIAVNASAGSDHSAGLMDIKGEALG